MVWSEETILLLRELWAAGHSTAEIGRRLGVTKNAIVGKAHRLDLTARPSPIRRGGTGAVSERPPPPIRLEGPTLPPLASAMPQPVPALLPALRPAALAPAAVARRFAEPAPVAAAVRAMLPRPAFQNRRPAPSCCWPIGEPGKKDFHFCDDPSVPGKPYCEDHAKLAYVKIRDRKEDAA